MPAHKIAISLPPEVVVAVDRAARDRGVPRSRFEQREVSERYLEAQPRKRTTW